MSFCSRIYVKKTETVLILIDWLARNLTLDYLTKDAKPPFLLKLDVQGSELDILLGAEEVLHETEYIILEVSLYKFFKGGPDYYDIVTFMRSRGFVVYDIFGLHYRPLDNALSQVDMVFVKEKGLFRKNHFYATKEQREKLNERFELSRRKFLKQKK